MHECKQYITHHNELSDLEREALRVKFIGAKPGSHKAIFCHETRTMVLGVPFHVSWRKTQQAIRAMVNFYSPDRMEVVAMPMGAV